jgi:hypothetical protein
LTPTTIQCQAFAEIFGFQAVTTTKPQSTQADGTMT